MKKVKSITINKIWGYEKILYSCVKDMETSVDGKKTVQGPLIKIIQANDPLSVQVHPDDALAKELENENNGKAESWYVLEAKKDSKMVIGLKDYNHEHILKMLKNKTFEENLLTTNVIPGDFINVPAGLVHGIGAGIKVLEVQQPSNTTYRYFDYNRLENGKPRELHIEKALKSQKDLSYQLQKESSKYIDYKNSVGTQSYRTETSILEKDSIIVDITNEVCYEAKAGEQILLDNYCVVSYIAL